MALSAILPPVTPSPLSLIRLLDPSDSIHDLTLLINRAYKTLADMGLKYVGTWQDDDMTRKRVGKGECWVGLIDDEIVATIHLRSTTWPSGAPWYEREDVMILGQFAVKPELQKRGIGSTMLEHMEKRAKEKGALELALDTADSATHLIQWYEKRGYRFVEYVTWGPIVNYRSVILSKTL
jgi:GNAT superfamily N-acetyltransferase